jgi:hypothetical protein
VTTKNIPKNSLLRSCSVLTRKEAHRVAVAFQKKLSLSHRYSGGSSGATDISAAYKDRTRHISHAGGWPFFFVELT